MSWGTFASNGTVTLSEIPAAFAGTTQTFYGNFTADTSYTFPFSIDVDVRNPSPSIVQNVTDQIILAGMVILLILQVLVSIPTMFQDSLKIHKAAQ